MGTLQTKSVLRSQAEDTEEFDDGTTVGEGG